MKPDRKPIDPSFASGLCSKLPGFLQLHLRNTPFGRSHRSPIVSSNLREIIERTRSNTSVCLTLDLDKDQLKKLTDLLAEEKVALDCASYREAPPGLRFWAGATVMTADVEAVCPWIEWAYRHVR